jgi:hypothetical protein
MYKAQLELIQLEKETLEHQQQQEGICTCNTITIVTHDVNQPTKAQPSELLLATTQWLVCDCSQQIGVETDRQISPIFFAFHRFNQTGFGGGLFGEMRKRLVKCE